MNEEQMNSLVDRLISAFNRGDVEDFCNCFHPDLEWTKLPDGNPIYRGLAEFKKKFNPDFGVKEDLHCELIHRFTTQNTVVTQEKITGLSNLPQGYFVGYVYAFKDGLISKMWSVR